MKRRAGRAGGRHMVALAFGGVVCAVTVGLVLRLGALAQAQEPIYQIPTPTPTGTPFVQPPPPAKHKPGMMKPFPVVRTAGTYTRNRTIFTRITVKAPRGARIEATCNRHRCKRTKKTLHRLKTVRLKRMQRSYPARTTLTIRVGSAHAIGKYVAIRTRRGKPPRRHDSCIRPGKRASVACPGG